MSDRPTRERPVRKREEPVTDATEDAASGRIGVYEATTPDDRRRTGAPRDETPESVGVYDRPAEADRGISPIVLALIVLVVLIVLAVLAFTLLF